ncbi:MAG: hypothetical protein OEL83_03735 [Desulforhopalus sp.]|nr:hypothetical protein [Desulforhopalus sp.]
MDVRTVAQKVLCRLISCMLAVSLVGLPLNSGVAFAAEHAVVPATAKKVETEKAVILNDHKKAVPATASSSTSDKATVASTGTPAVSAEQKPTGENKANDASHAQAAQAGHDEKSEEGLSTAAKVGIGVGVAVVIGGAALALGGGGSSGDSGPKYPTAAELVGKWDGRGISHDGVRRYLGVYDLRAGGVHTYSIVLNDGVHHEGQGTWSIAEGTNTLTIRNGNSSVYVGDFQGENFTTISMTARNTGWDLVLTKK